MTPATVGCCDVCSIPLDAHCFDVSGFASGESLPQPGERIVLATFEVHPQYCGVLECFAQFTDVFANDNSRVRTPGLEWVLLRNDKPIFPYQRIESVLNPWGYGNYSFRARLDENSRVDFVLRNHDFDFSAHHMCEVGGRMMGRYWYNSQYGGERRSA